jgi:hypothetical protein
MADGLFGGAAFGVYPQMQPRRRLQDVQGSANLPIDVLRGRIAGLFGLVPDVLNFMGRSPMPTETFGETQYNPRPQLPYDTDYYLKNLPMAPTARVGQVAGQAASFVPLNPMPAVRGVQRVGQMVGEELGATMMGQRPNSMMSKVVPQPLFAVAPEQGLLSTKVEPIESLLQTKPQAPVSDIGFYSATEQAALNLGRNKGTGQSFINDLMKAPDVKKEELAYTGLDDFLRDKPNVTKQEVQDFLANNRVDVQEVTYGAQIAEDPIGIAARKEVFDKFEPEIQDLYRRIDKPEYVVYDAETNTVLKNYTNYDDALLDNLDPMGAFSKARTGLRPKENSRQLQQQITDLQNLRDAQADAVYKVPESTPTKFGKYQLAGGENYREILLTLPQKPQALPEGFNVDAYSVNGVTKYGVYDANGQRYGSGATKEEALQKFGELHQDKPYQSSHFNEPNILAHMRVNDRVDADGKKMLLVEEIQSDWHQAGRERGYKTKEGLEKWYNQNKLDDDPSFADLNSEQRSVIERNRDAGMGGDNAVPDAPFKDTWYQLALKRLTKYAAENGYERIGLTTGRQQAGRYKLSNEVDEINVIGRTNMATGEKSKSVALDMKSGQSLRIGVNNDGIVDNVSDESIKNFMGKNLSEVVGKDIAKEIMLNNKKTISGEGLDIGGEGMKKYYDEIYPKFLDKYGKKYGASVGETKVNTVMERADNSMIPKMGQEPVRYLDITPQMKEGTSKGQPLFAATPLLPATSLLDEEKRKEITSLLE